MAGNAMGWWRSEAEPSGRETELSLLERELDDARSLERARVVLVRGPQGVGKSHLFALARQALAAKGAAIFEGASAREVKKSFGLFLPVLEQALEQLTHDGLPPDVLARLNTAVAAVQGKVPAPADRLAHFDALGEVCQLASRRSAAFFFPDVEVADKSSQELLRYLLAVATTPSNRSRALFVVSLRDGAPLPRPVAELVERVSARSLNLQGLDLEGLRSFLSRADVAQRLLEVTGGNPQLLGELLEAPAGQAVDFFLHRARRLEPSAQALLDVLALAGRPVPVALASAVAGPHAVGQLDQLVRTRFATSTLHGGVAGYGFARDSEREAWLALIAPERARSVTLSLGRALVAEGELEGGARLLLQAAPAEGASVALQAAAQLHVRGALEGELELLLSALPQLRGEARASAHRAVATAAEMAGDAHLAARHALAEGRLSKGSTEERALVAARALVRLGRGGLARLCLKAAQRKAALAPAAAAVRSELAAQSGELLEAAELAKQALGAAVEPEVRVALLQAQAKALLGMGTLSEARALYATAAADAASAGLEAQAALAQFNEGVAAHRMGDRARAMECYQATPSHLRSAPKAHANLGSLHAERGEFEQAVSHLESALQQLSRQSSAREVGQVAINLARVHHLIGDLDRASELSGFALERALPQGDSYVQASAHLTLGAVAFDRAQGEEALFHFEEARVRFERIRNLGFAALAVGLKAQVHLSLGARGQAEVELSRSVVERGCAASPAATLEVELARGELSLSAEDLLGAGRALVRARDALLTAEELEGPWRVQYLSARLKALAKDEAARQAELLKAGRLLEELAGKVPPAHRTAFLSVPRRAELLGQTAGLLPSVRPTPVPLSAPATHGLVGRSATLSRLTKQIGPIGRSNATVLIRGESGTGKELLAEALHQASPRRSMPLVKVNCAAMVEELLLSELFGHEKGAFTGAVRERKGRFELADGGTLFLDEIGDISPKCQVALLRVLQEKEFERVGGSKTMKVDARVICATNRDLEALIAQGRFRADLYYRLKGVMLELPALRQRPEDLGVLSAHFLTRVARERGESPKRLSEASLQLLSRHTWPGNVRELENVLAAAAIFAEGAVVEPEAFLHVQELRALWDAGAQAPAPMGEGAPVAVGVSAVAPLPAGAVAMPMTAGGELDFYELARQRDLSLKDLRHQMEMQCIRRALTEAQGNISEAARLLKMKRSRLSQIVNGELELKEVAHGDEA